MADLIPNPTAASPWPTILKITLDLSKRSFSPSFRCSPLGAMKHNILCSCSQITAFNIDENKQAILFDFPLDSNKPRFVFYDSARVESARELCDIAAKHNTSTNFIFVAQELMGSLAKICEGKSTPDMKKRPGDTNLKPFRTDLLDNKSVCEELRTKICAPLNHGEFQDHGMGYIYILRSRSYGTLGELKIGFSKHHPEHRAHQLAGCLRNPEVVAHSPMIPHASRIETIIHAELVLLRKTQFCAQCQQQHKEWFTVSHIQARQVVTRWCRWVLNQPYQNGVLTSQWQDHLNKQDFNQHLDSDRLSKIWKEIIDTYPIDESSESIEKQRALYVNAMFLEKNLRSACDQAQLPNLRDNFDDLLGIARTMQSRNGGLGFSSGSIEVPDAGSLQRFDNVVDFPLTQPITWQDHQARHQSSLQEVEELVEHLKTTNTGCLSVSSPDLGKSESPMGDSTILPVVTFKELEYFDSQAKLAIGYNPTNVGFQFLQEAYQRGEWNGPLPRFKRSSGPHMFGTRIPPGTHRHTEFSSGARKTSRQSHDADAPSSYRMREHELDSANSQEPVFAAVSSEGRFSTRKRKMQTEVPDFPDTEMTSGECTAGFTKVKYNPGQDGEKSIMTFSTPLVSNSVGQIDKIVEEIRNGGRGNVERALNESFRRLGIETMVPSDGNWATDGTKSSSEVDSLSSEASPPQDPSKQDESDTKDGFSNSAAVTWFNLS